VNSLSGASSKQKVIACARVADSKKAADIVILDIRKLTFLTDYFLICTGFNARQIQTIADEIEKKMAEENIVLLGEEGYQQASWVLLDYGDFVVHIFDPGARKTYDLELLWGDAPKIDWRQASP